MRIHIAAYANCEELEEDSGIKLRDCDFTQMAENGSMIWFNCSDDKIEELEEEIEYYEKEEMPKTFPGYMRILNELALIKYIRKCMRATDGIYVYWYW